MAEPAGPPRRHRVGRPLPAGLDGRLHVIARGVGDDTHRGRRLRHAGRGDADRRAQRRRRRRGVGTARRLDGRARHRRRAVDRRRHAAAAPEPRRHPPGRALHLGGRPPRSPSTRCPTPSGGRATADERCRVRRRTRASPDATECVGESGAPARATPRFPAFDGLRAIAAITVLGVHSAFVSGLTSRDPAVGIYTARLEAGVAVFFLISGFLLYRPFVVAHLRGAPQAGHRLLLAAPPPAHRARLLGGAHGLAPHPRDGHHRSRWVAGLPVALPLRADLLPRPAAARPHPGLDAVRRDELLPRASRSTRRRSGPGGRGAIRGSGCGPSRSGCWRW